MKRARIRRDRGVGLAAALCLFANVSCASIRPVRDVIGPEEAVEDRAGASLVEGAAGALGAAADEAPGGGAEEAAPSGGTGPDGGRMAPAKLPGREELRAWLAARMEAADERCNGLLDALDGAGEEASYAQLMDASRALVFNADLRIQSDVVLRFEPDDLPSVNALISAEDDVSSELKSDVRSLAKSSRDLADRALELREDDAAARLFSTLGTGLYLWSLGPFEALANGAATTLPRRIKALAEERPEFEGASPLRLMGRFQSRAPWPFKDVDGGVETLVRAAEIAPIPLNLVFLGDAHWLNDQPEEARAAWRRAVGADADEETKDAAPALREIARLRLLAAESER